MLGGRFTKGRVCLEKRGPTQFDDVSITVHVNDEPKPRLYVDH